MEQEKQTILQKPKREYCENGLKKNGDYCIVVSKYLKSNKIVGTEIPSRKL